MTEQSPRQAAERIVEEVFFAEPPRATVARLLVAITDAIQNASNAQLARGRANDIREYAERQRQWNRSTFGEGTHTGSILRHIRKELEEIAAKPDDLEEWIDVIILAINGYWRHGGEPADLMTHLQAKQDKNIARRWPAPGPGDEPVEHVRE